MHPCLEHASTLAMPSHASGHAFMCTTHITDVLECLTRVLAKYASTGGWSYELRLEIESLILDASMFQELSTRVQRGRKVGSCCSPSLQFFDAQTSHDGASHASIHLWVTKCSEVCEEFAHTRCIHVPRIMHPWKEGAKVGRCCSHGSCDSSKRVAALKLSL